MVHHERLRRENQTQPARSQAQTQVHILVGGKKMFVEATDFAEERLAHHQARTGESGDFARADETAGVAVHADRETPHRVIGCSAHAQRHAGMLDRAVFVDQQRTGRAHVRLLGVINQMLEPIFAHDLGVVAGMTDRVMVMYGGQIVERAEVEDLYYRPRMPYTWGLLSSMPRVDRLGSRLIPIPGAPPPLASRCG